MEKIDYAENYLNSAYYFNESVDNSINNVYTIIERGDLMEAKIQKWGNSDGIRIPGALLKSMDLKTNDIVELILDDDSLTIRKKQKSHITLRDRMKNCPNTIDDFEKIDYFGEPRGKEIW